MDNKLNITLTYQGRTSFKNDEERMIFAEDLLKMQCRHDMVDDFVICKDGRVEVTMIFKNVYSQGAAFGSFHDSLERFFEDHDKQPKGKYKMFVMEVR